jgi:hypothetical protein
MSQPFASHPGQSNPLAESIRHLDKALSRPIKQELAPTQAATLLQQVEKFYHQAWQQQDQSTTLSENAELRMLLAAGCRLSTDLNETVLTQLVDQAQSQDAQIAQLSQTLAQQIMIRAKTGQLLKKAQQLKQHGVQTADIVGLGVIL